MARDVEPALCAAARSGVPLVIGTAGGSGAKPRLAAFQEIVWEIAGRNELSSRAAVIPADLQKDTVLDALCEGRVSPCGHSHTLIGDHVRECTHAGNAHSRSGRRTSGGPVYEFAVYHLTQVQDPAALLPIEFLEV